MSKQFLCSVNFTQLCWGCQETGQHCGGMRRRWHACHRPSLMKHRWNRCLCHVSMADWHEVGGGRAGGVESALNVTGNNVTDVTVLHDSTVLCVSFLFRPLHLQVSWQEKEGSATSWWVHKHQKGSREDSHLIVSRYNVNGVSLLSS